MLHCNFRRGICCNQSRLPYHASTLSRVCSLISNYTGRCVFCCTLLGINLSTLIEKLEKGEL